MRLNLDWCDVRDLSANDGPGVLERELSGRTVTVEMADQRLPLARLDFTLMQQSLANLLLNAASHTPPGTAIRLQVRTEPGWLVFNVADEGPGLPPELLPGASLTSSSVLLALPPVEAVWGLAIVKGFVEAHGGRISAANRPGGRGRVRPCACPKPEMPPAEIT